MAGDRQRQADSKGSLPPTGKESPEPSGSRGSEREGEITSVQTRVMGEGRGIMLEGEEERIRRRDSEGRGGGATGHVGTSNVAVI